MVTEQKEITISPWGSGIGCRSHFLLRTASARSALRRTHTWPPNGRRYPQSPRGCTRSKFVRVHMYRFASEIGYHSPIECLGGRHGEGSDAQQQRKEEAKAGQEQ